MRKILLWAIVMMVSLTFLGCDVATTSPNGDEETTQAQANTDVDQLKSLLIAEGYGLDERDAESVEYYNSHAVNDTYSIDVTVLEVYLGYVNQVERWAELIGFESVTDAQTFTSAIDSQDTSGMLYYRLGTAVVITYSQDTIDALS